MELGAIGRDGPIDKGRLAWDGTVTAARAPVTSCRPRRFRAEQIL